LRTFEVTEVGLLPERTEWLLGFEIDMPQAGTREGVHVLHLVGWVVGRDVAAVSVDLMRNGEVIRTTPVRGARDDVAAAIGVDPATDCVFHVLAGLLGLGPNPRLELEVVLADGTRVPVGWISLVRRPFRSGFAPKLRPLIVNCPGRSGSTFLMKLLAAHPEVVVFRRFPYESAPARYWMHMLSVLAEPANLIQSTHTDTFSSDRWSIGSNPFHDDRVYEQKPLADWFAGDHVEELAAFCQRSVDEWYTTLARTQVQPDAVYFAEKHMWPDHLPRLMRELYPEAREVFLVRDFRDMALSILSFDRRRGFPGFRRPEGLTDIEYVHGVLREMTLGLTAAWRERREGAHLLRYEDLVAEPGGSLTALFAYLGLDALPATVERVIAHGAAPALDLPGASFEPSDLEGHRTTPSLEASIGRFRTEADREFLAATEEAFGEALREFGYSEAQVTSA
jgi:hypothetical protein